MDRVERQRLSSVRTTLMLVALLYSFALLFAPCAEARGGYASAEQASGPFSVGMDTSPACPMQEAVARHHGRHPDSSCCSIGAAVANDEGDVGVPPAQKDRRSATPYSGYPSAPYGDAPSSVRNAWRIAPGTPLNRQYLHVSRLLI